MKKKFSVFVILLIFIFFYVFLLVNKEENFLKESIRKIGAEQSGSSPESGATSKLKTAYDFLVSKGTNYGNTQPSDWTYSSYGNYWNRILYSAAWEPDGTATEEDVIKDFTFYSEGRILRVGSKTYPSMYSNQSLVDYDDGHASDYTGEESSWVNTATGVWKDTRTGLYWSSKLGNYSNGFSSPASGYCDFFTSDTNGDYGNSGTDPDCGDSINLCADLNLSSGGTSNTDWYLPSQKELMQAQIDGVRNSGASSDQWFWSSTQGDSSDSKAWFVVGWCHLVSEADKTSANSTRCVRYDK